MAADASLETSGLVDMGGLGDLAVSASELPGAWEVGKFEAAVGELAGIGPACDLGMGTTEMTDVD